MASVKEWRTPVQSGNRAGRKVRRAGDEAGPPGRPEVHEQVAQQIDQDARKPRSERATTPMST